MSRPCMPPGRWGAALSLTPVGKGAINKGILWKVSRERRAEYHGKMEKIAAHIGAYPAALAKWLAVGALIGGSAG